ncbi:MAG: hypothetical protein Q4C96_05300 [Planctomycetia bacterium]|nr:hypothetical protein [Planctomycetia bacterium]
MRNFFYALGFFLILAGTECFFIDKFVFKYQNTELVDAKEQTYQKVPCEFHPSQNTAWCLIFAGGSLILYNITSAPAKK